MSQNELTMTRRGVLIALVLGLLAVPGGSAFADDGGGDGGGGDGGGGDGGDDDGGDGGGDDNSGEGNANDEGQKIRNAVRDGNAASLKEILAVVRQKFKGQVVRVRVAGAGTRIVYNIRLLDEQNRLINIRVNANSRRIISAGSSFR